MIDSLCRESSRCPFAPSSARKNAFAMASPLSEEIRLRLSARMTSGMIMPSPFKKSRWGPVDRSEKRDAFRSQHLLFLQPPAYLWSFTKCRTNAPKHLCRRLVPLTDFTTLVKL
jgi:hypothetical protein